jgi:LuxR family transcriptional regulator, maltose regulon positive regulatory protein
MPYAETPWVRQGRVVTPDGRTIHIDTQVWFAWLDQITCFGYSTSQHWLRLTVRREKRRRQHYWYAYSKINGKLHNVYLGKSDQLTHARLEQACQQIRRQTHKKEVIHNNSTESVDVSL